MITIIVDLRRLNTSAKGALRADSVDDYVPLRRRIRQALDQQADLSVYVTSPVLLHALEDLRDYRDSVTWHDVDPAAIFEHIFRQPPTPPFTTEILAALDLDLLPNPGGSVDPLSWVLRKRLDPLWGYPAPPNGHEREVIMWAAQSGELPNVIAILLAAQLARWSEEHPVYTALRPAHLRADAQSLLIRAAMRHYDSTWIRRQPWGSLPLVDLNELEDTAAEALHPLEHTLADYWKHRYAASDRASEVIDLALDQMSGLSIVELDELDAMLRDHPSRLVPMLFDQIARRFHRLAFTAALARLQRRMAPLEPTLPDQTWDDPMWLRWGTRDYMPYFAWVIRNGVARDHQRACALHFSDWLHQRYPTWLNSDDSPVLIRQFRELRDLLDADSDAVVLWLIVDGLTWWQGAILLEECRSQGLHPQAYEPGVAVLPSITSISKRALITGVTTIDLEARSVAEVARAQLVQSGITARVSYRFAEIRAALELPDGPRCLVLLHNMVDVLAHKLSEFSDGGVIRGCLDDLAAELGQIRSLCERRGRRLHVLVGSDHGSTLLPTDAEHQEMPQTTREIEDLWEPATADRELPRPSSRAAVISDPNRVTVDESEHWYVLSRERFQLDRHYAVPRGEGYIGRRPEGWTHGGLTPEEVIVPLIRLSAELPRLLPIEIRIEGSMRARQEGSLDVTLINPNRLPLDDVQLRIAEADNIVLDVLSASSSLRQSVRVAAPVTSASELPIRWALSYRMMGDVHRQEGSRTIPVRRLSVDESGFDDLFGE